MANVSRGRTNGGKRTPSSANHLQENVNVIKRSQHKSGRGKRPSSWKQILKVGILVIVIIVLVTVLVRIHANTQSKKTQSDAVNAGVAYLESLEGGDVDAIQTEITKIAKEKRVALLEENPDAVWSAFNDAVIIGDSRAVGFSSYEWLPEERVLAQAGGKITDVPDYITQLKTLQPSMVFLCFGLNDIGIGLWPTGEEYTAEYITHVQEIQEALPNADVYVCSVLPAVAAGLQADSDYSRIPEYNEALQQMCEENDLVFVDATETAEANEDLYQPDGLHLQSTFYPLWATDMISEVE